MTSMKPRCSLHRNRPQRLQTSSRVTVFHTSRRPSPRISPSQATVKFNVTCSLPPPKNELEATVRRKHKEVTERLENLGPEGVEFNLRYATPSKSSHHLLKCITAANQMDARTALIIEVIQPQGDSSCQSLVSRCEHLVAMGADALAANTDAESTSRGSQELEAISATMSVPVVRLDWIIHPIQLTETTALGATGITLVNCLLTSATEKMLRMCRTLKLDAIVEVVNSEELNLALDYEAVMFGINISVGLSLALPGIKEQMSKNLIANIPPGAVSVVGVTSAAEAHAVAMAGASAVLLKKEALIGLSREEMDILIREVKIALESTHIGE